MRPRRRRGSADVILLYYTLLCYTLYRCALAAVEVVQSSVGAAFCFRRAREPSCTITTHTYAYTFCFRRAWKPSCTTTPHTYTCTFCFRRDYKKPAKLAILCISTSVK